MSPHKEFNLGKEICNDLAEHGWLSVEGDHTHDDGASFDSQIDIRAKVTPA